MFSLAGFVSAAWRRSSGAACARARGRARVRATVALVSLVKRNRRRYGGYLVHVGIVVLFVGVAASSSFKDIRDVAASPGQSARVGGTSSRTSSRSPSCTPRQRAPGADRVRRRLRVDGRDAAHVEGLLPVPGQTLGPVSRASSTASRRPRSRWTRSLRQGPLGRGRAGHREAAPRIEEGDRLFRTRGRALGRGLHRSSPSSLHGLPTATRRPAAGSVNPPHHTIEWMDAWITAASSHSTPWPPQPDHRYTPHHTSVVLPPPTGQVQSSSIWWCTARCSGPARPPVGRG